MKSKLYSFNPVIYPFRLVVTKSFDEEEMKARFSRVESKSLCVDLKDEDLQFGGTESAHTTAAADRETSFLTELILLNVSRDDISVGSLSHEAMHAVADMTSWFGFPDFANYTSEPYCYLEEWITDCIYSVFTDKPESMGGELLK